MKNSFLAFTVLGVIAFACSPGTKQDVQNNSGVQSEAFGVLPDSSEVTRFTLTNANGITMQVISYGGIITSLSVPDRDGNLADIVLGYDNLDDYVASNPYFGALIGRYGNRIANGKFKLDSVEYALATNNGPNHLHGGLKGFDKVNWIGGQIEVANGVGIKLQYTSKDGEEGYPGTLIVEVLYQLLDDNSLIFDYTAMTDQTTIVNLTNHSYFNLSGMKTDILGHELMINAAQYLPVDNTLIPTKIDSVGGTPFDFTRPKKIGQDINNDHEQLKNGNGYDHCWILNPTEEEMNFAASLYDATSGRFMEIFTTEPGIQFYSGNFLNGSNTGKSGVVYTHRMGLCLETQHYPDTPNRPDFPSVTLKPGEQYHTVTKTVFSIK